MSLQDSLFSELVERDINEFAVKEKRKRVLVFPPVNNYRRFIIHQFVQNYYQQSLYTFSIGQGANRRTVVCYKTDVIRDPKLNGALLGGTRCGESNISDLACAMGVEGHNRSSSPLVSPENSTRQRQVKSVPSVGIYRPPPARRTARCDNTQSDSQQDQPASDSSLASKANRQKRPDRAVYVPRHRRSNESERSSLSRETSKAHRSTRERRSTTTSPAHTSQTSSVDSSLVSIDPSLTICGKEDENYGSDSQSVIEINDKEKYENSLPQPFESPIRENLAGINVSGVEQNQEIRDKVTSDKLAGFSSSIDNSDEHLPIDENSLFILNNGVAEESRDAFSPEETLRVQKDEEFIRQHETGLILDSCEGGGAKGSEINFVKEITSVEKGEKEMSEQQTNGNSSDLIMSRESNRKEDKTKEDLLINREEVVNHKNRRIVRQNLVSDVLLISDEVSRQTNVLDETSAVSPVPPSSPPKEKKIKKVERPKSKPAPPPSPPSKVNRDECDWDSLFDDNGDCLDPTLIEELTTAVGEVTIEQPRSDYRSYSKAPIEVSNDEFAHVVEIYNFPSDFKTSDLAAVFSPFKNGGFELKWVDDTHCLGVFSSPLIAAEVLASDHSFVKTRPLSEATALSKTKARRSAEFLQPYRARPETCAALARRLVTGALGVRLSTARQEREREKIVLQEAKERRRLANKQREDAWEGIIADK